jgi:hypothetical protein
MSPRYCNRVPRIVEYQTALAELQGQGLICNYYNGGAFGFPKGVEVDVSGWIAGEDPTIRAEIRSKTRVFSPPAEENMARAAVAAWQKELGGRAWIMPLSHWAFELDFGSKGWLPALISGAGVDPQALADQPNAAPIEFVPSDHERLVTFVQTLLINLASSDFMLAFPGQSILCTIHHHKQLWWASSDKSLLERVERHSANFAL